MSGWAKRVEGSSKGSPLAMEISVPPLSGPYLVTRLHEFAWWDKPLVGDRVRAMVRTGSAQDTCSEALLELLRMSVESGWGNNGPLTSAGLSEGMLYLRRQGFQQLTLWVRAEIPLEIPQLKVSVTDTVPEGIAFLTPEESKSPGWLFTFGSDHALCVFNARRGCFVLNGRV